MVLSSAYTILNREGKFPLLFTCEHASCFVPVEYQNLGIKAQELRRHIGWDIGAGEVVRVLTQELDATAVCAGYSRLLIDCNRDLRDHDLIVAESDGVSIPANRSLSSAERERRMQKFYYPYHQAIDQLLAEKGSSLLLSIHSFTPTLRGQERRFDVGVLFDRYNTLASELGQRIEKAGFNVRYNEPYSGHDGLIFSARNHGERYGMPYVELEINNGLIAEAEGAAIVGEKVCRVVQDLFASGLPCAGG
jgi:predicted N-formylglutamate amidohydrolase